MDDNSRPPADGFEYQGVFYRWHVTTVGKDLILIDRFSGLPIQEFFGVIEDEFDRSRIPILLAMVATSIRNEHPDWTVERIVRTVMDLDLSEVTFVEADTEADTLPPASEDAPPASTGNGSSSESKRTSSDQGQVTSATSSRTLV